MTRAGVTSPSWSGPRPRSPCPVTWSPGAAAAGTLGPPYRRRWPARRCCSTGPGWPPTTGPTGELDAVERPERPIPVRPGQPGRRARDRRRAHRRRGRPRRRRRRTAGPGRRGAAGRGDLGVRPGGQEHRRRTGRDGRLPRAGRAARCVGRPAGRGRCRRRSPSPRTPRRSPPCPAARSAAPTPPCRCDPRRTALVTAGATLGPGAPAGARGGPRRRGDGAPTLAVGRPGAAGARPRPAVAAALPAGLAGWYATSYGAAQARVVAEPSADRVRAAVGAGITGAARVAGRARPPRPAPACSASRSRRPPRWRGGWPGRCPRHDRRRTPAPRVPTAGRCGSRRRLRFGYGTNGFANHRLDDALAVIADLGYDGVALTLDHDHLDPFAPGLARRVAAVGRRLARARPRRGGRDRCPLPARPVAQARADAAARRPRPRRIDFLRRAVAIGADLGAEAVSFWAGVRPGDVAAGRGLGPAGRRLRRRSSRRADRRRRAAGLRTRARACWSRTSPAGAGCATRLGEPAGFGITLDIGHCRCLEPRAGAGLRPRGRRAPGQRADRRHAPGRARAPGVRRRRDRLPAGAGAPWPRSATGVWSRSSCPATRTPRPRWRPARWTSCVPRHARAATADRPHADDAEAQHRRERP